MTFHLMFVHIIFSSVWVAEWPLFGNSCSLGLPYNCSLCILTICNFSYIPFWFWGPDLGSECFSFLSYGVYISQLIRFARASSHVTDFNNRNKFLTAKLFKQGYRYHKLRKAFSKFYRRHFSN